MSKCAQFKPASDVITDSARNTMFTHKKYCIIFAQLSECALYNDNSVINRTILFNLYLVQGF